MHSKDRCHTADCISRTTVAEYVQAAAREILYAHLATHLAIPHKTTASPALLTVACAADCIRQDYASLAEHAYPEAYSEFKHSMLLLIFAQDLENSPVKADWSVHARSQLAGMLCRTLKEHAGEIGSGLHLYFLKTVKL